MHQGHIASTSMVLFVQNVVIMGLLWTYRQPDLAESTKRTFAELVGIAITAAYIVPPEEHWFLMCAAVGLAAAASIPQLVRNVQQGHTGRLSLTSLVLQLVGSLVSVGLPTGSKRPDYAAGPSHDTCAQGGTGAAGAALLESDQQRRFACEEDRLSA